MRKRMKGRPPHISGSQIIEAEKGEEKGAEEGGGEGASILDSWKTRASWSEESHRKVSVVTAKVNVIFS